MGPFQQHLPLLCAENTRKPLHKVPELRVVWKQGTWC